MRFSNKVVAITGAAQGIGRQTAEQAAREGARLLLIDRSRYVHELAAALNDSGSEAWRWRPILSNGKAPSGRLPKGWLILVALTC